jgi:hypothetical protein
VPDPESRTPSPAIVQFLTSEHFVLQSARAATVSDINGRASIFLGTVSAGVVALAFLGQASALGPAFYAFALVLFPALVFLGFATLARALQSSIEETIYARGMNRIRHYFVERNPNIAAYLIQSTHDDATGVMWNAGLTLTWWQMWLTTAGMLAMITAILVGVSAGFAAGALGRWGLPGCIGIGALAFIAAFAGFNRYQQRRWAELDRRLEVRFPTPSGASSIDRQRAGSNAAITHDS